MIALQAGHGCTCEFGQFDAERTCPYLNEAVVDPALTETGQAEALSARSVFEAMEGTAMAPQAVFVSPLMRTVQTATLVFPGRTGLVALEGFREQMGAHHCDKRSAVSAIRDTYSHVDFAHVATDEDELWTSERETKLALAQRAQQALSDLFTLTGPDTRTVAVITHSALLRSLTRVAMDTSRSPETAKRFQTAEVRSILVQRQSSGD